jgi:hypothetical protein
MAVTAQESGQSFRDARFVVDDQNGQNMFG